MPRFTQGDVIYVGTQRVPTEDELEMETGYRDAPVSGSPQQEATNKIFRFVFDKPVFKYLTVESTFKGSFKLATDGTTFSALGGSDSVAIDGKIVTLTFNVALAGATNKIRFEASALQDVFGNTNAQQTFSITVI